MPIDPVDPGLDLGRRRVLQPLAQAIRSGLDRGSAADAGRRSLESRLILDLIRDRGPKAGERWLSQAAEVARETGILAVGLGGTEARFPPEAYAPVYRRALGFHRTAHAGESAGPDSVWGAIRSLGVERIGHGTRCREDPELVTYLRSHAIPLEVCPTSNVCTRSVPSIEEHPLASYHRNGLLVTLSSDAPVLFDTSLVREYEIARDRMGLTPTELVRIARTGFEVAFLPETDRMRVLDAFDRQVSGILRG